MSRVRMLIKLCLVLLSIELVSCDWKPSNKIRETLCNTAECKARGEEYKRNLNTKVNPCQDFYTFTCGNWQKNHPGPKYTSTWSIMDVIEFDFLNIIRRLLETYNFNAGDDIKFRQAKLIYEYCIKIPQYPIKEAKHIARDITNVGRLPKTSLWAIHLKYLYLSGESSLFRTTFLVTKSPTDVPVIMVLEPTSAYGLIYHEEVWKPQEKQAYTDFLFLIMTSLKLKDSDKVIKERVGKLFQFREKLNRIIVQNKKKKPDAFKPYSGQKLDDWFSRTLRQRTSTQNILWAEVLVPLLQSVPEHLRRTRKIFAMRQKEYFLELMDLLKETPADVIASHMEIYFIESHLKLNEKMYKLLEGTSVEPHSLSYYIKDKYYPRWHTCIDELNMKETLEKLLYQKWFRKEIADRIHAINGGVKSAIENQIRKSTWLDELTRTETVEKIKKVEEWIGFPPWIDGNGKPTIERNKNEILIAQASLYTSSNLLYIQAPYLMPPMFSPTIPNVYNYAGTATTLAHELYHVIDDCGQYDQEEEKVVWWKPVMRHECLKRKARFIDVYNQVTNTDFKNRYNIDLKSDTSSSVLENIPDVMGLKAAYNAYKELALKEKSTCQTLPNFEKYSCDQMFYIAFANAYCGYYNKKSAESRIIGKSSHSLDSIRINGAVAQMKSFGTAFGCPVGSLMNPPEKLDLWNALVRRTSGGGNEGWAPQVADASRPPAHCVPALRPSRTYVIVA